jgi:hypothetical protein
MWLWPSPPLILGLQSKVTTDFATGPTLAHVTPRVALDIASTLHVVSTFFTSLNPTHLSSRLAMSLMDDEFGHHDLDMEHDLHHDPMDELDRFEIFMPAVQSLVNALGGYEEVPTPEGGFETIYRPGDSVVAVLKDLKKLWRKDDSDDERTVARCMARAGLMKELIALLVECTDRGEWGRKVALVACQFMLLE